MHMKWLLLVTACVRQRSFTLTMSLRKQSMSEMGMVTALLSGLLMMNYISIGLGHMQLNLCKTPDSNSRSAAHKHCTS